MGMGKRDAAFDSGLPTPALHFRPGDDLPRPAPLHWSVTRMMDQHAYLDIALGDDLQVGDMIGFDISHPCLTFDKWRLLPIVNAGYDVIDLVQTFLRATPEERPDDQTTLPLSLALAAACAAFATPQADPRQTAITLEENGQLAEAENAWDALSKQYPGMQNHLPTWA